MSQSERSYEETLVWYFEEEIEGEAYFHALAEYFDEPGAAEKLHVMAEVERCAADTMRPLLKRHNLETRDEDALRAGAVTRIGKDAKRTWPEFVDHVVDYFPIYVPMFEALENMAPPEDHAALERLTDHEHVTIDFAKREQAGDSDSARPMLDYITLCDGKG
jgi:dimethylamine/trimethylamine dehydrogenase